MIYTFLKKASHFQELSNCSPIHTSYNLKIKMSVTEKMIHWNFKITKSALLKTVFTQNWEIQLHELTSLASPSLLATLLLLCGVFFLILIYCLLLKHKHFFSLSYGKLWYTSSSNSLLPFFQTPTLLNGWSVHLRELLCLDNKGHSLINICLNGTHLVLIKYWW